METEEVQFFYKFGVEKQIFDNWVGQTAFDVYKDIEFSFSRTSRGLRWSSYPNCYESIVTRFSDRGFTSFVVQTGGVDIYFVVGFRFREA